VDWPSVGWGRIWRAIPLYSKVLRGRHSLGAGTSRRRPSYKPELRGAASSGSSLGTVRDNQDLIGALERFPQMPESGNDEERKAIVRAFQEIRVEKTTRQAI
jgi:hypothetical protein